MNIIQEFGSRYINERCADSVFLHPDGWVGMFIRADPERERVSVKKIQGTVGRISVSDEELHYDFFHSLSVFNIPELGWRAGLNGRALLYYSHTGGYGRGIRPGRNVRAFHWDYRSVHS